MLLFLGSTGHCRGFLFPEGKNIKKRKEKKKKRTEKKRKAKKRKEVGGHTTTHFRAMVVARWLTVVGR